MRVTYLYIIAIILLCACKTEEHYTISSTEILLKEDSAVILQPFFLSSLVQVSNKLIHQNKDYELVSIDTGSGAIGKYELPNALEESLRAKYGIVKSSDSITKSYKFYSIAPSTSSSFFVSCGLSCDEIDSIPGSIIKVISYASVILEFDENFNLLASYVMPEEQLRRATCIYMISFPFGVKNDTLITGHSSPSQDSMTKLTDYYILKNDSALLFKRGPVTKRPSFINSNGCNYFFPCFSTSGSNMYVNDESNMYALNDGSEYNIISDDKTKILNSGLYKKAGIVYTSYPKIAVAETKDILLNYYSFKSKQSTVLKNLGDAKTVYSLLIKDNLIMSVISKGDHIYLTKYAINEI